MGSDESGGASGRSIMLVVLVWSSQPWYTKMFSLLPSAPLRIPPGKEATLQVGDVPHPALGLPKAVWHISDSSTRAKEFLEKLPSSSCRFGD